MKKGSNPPPPENAKRPPPPPNPPPPGMNRASTRPRFQFGNVVVVEGDLIGVIVKTWGKSALGRPIHYDVYVRNFNAIKEYDEHQIVHYVYSRELLDQQHEYHC